MSDIEANIADAVIARPAALTSDRSHAEGQAIIEALDHAPLNQKHRIFLAALLAALMFDHAKPFNISFAIPGMASMWQLNALESSYLAVAGLTGLVIGSVFWGYMADHIGRRLTLLWTVFIFSIACLCGLAVEYWNSLLACLIMGFGVGGEAPIVYALAAEYIPAKSRARSLLFLGMLGSLLGYLQVAIVATIFKSFMPEEEAWRWMWLINIPLGLIIFVLRGQIVPESARFLISKGRIAEARKAAEYFTGPIQFNPTDAMSQISDRPSTSVVTAPQPRLYGRTLAIGFFSFAVGLANYSFVTWLPTLLKTVGYSGASGSAYLAVSALIALPALLVTSIALRKRGTRGTLVIYALLTGTALLTLGYGATFGLLTPLFLIPVTSSIFFLITSLNGTLSFYGAENFPTSMRVRRSGIVSALGKFGGVVGPFFGGLYLTQGGTWFGLNIPLAVGLATAGIMLAIIGVETHGRSLEQINANS